MDAHPTPGNPLEAMTGFEAHVLGPGDEAPALKVVRRREQSLLSLFELSRELSISVDLYRIADLTLFSLMGHFGTPRVALWILPDESPSQAVLVRSHGLREDVARALGAGLAPQFVDRYVFEQEPVQLADWAEAVRAPGAGLAVQNRLAILVPVGCHARLLGLIALGSRASEEPYWPLDLEYLAAAAGMVGVALDNTRLYHRMLEINRQLRQANENLTELDRLKSQFVQNVNHELRTPLSIMSGYIGYLLESGGLGPEQRRAVDILVEQSKRLTGLIENLLDFSSVTEGTLTLSCEEGDIEELVRSFAEARRSGVIGGLREFDCEIEEDLPRARFDYKHLTQALDLLLDNAVKFTPLGTRIKLRAHRFSDGKTNWVRVQVQDNGPGIRRQDQLTLFQSFRQVDGSTTRTAGGMGVGLVLVREVVEKMGGRLEFESQLGEGTTFSMLLPRGKP